MACYCQTNPFLLIASILLIVAPVARAGGPATKPARPLNVVVITGGHGFDTKAFPKLFEGYDDIRVTHVALKGYSEIFDDIKDWKYDVIVFYNMTQIKPTSDRPLAWCKTYGKACTCCIELGHGPGIFTDPNYRRFVSQAIRWTAPSR